VSESLSVPAASSAPGAGSRPPIQVLCAALPGVVEDDPAVERLREGLLGLLRARGAHLRCVEGRGSAALLEDVPRAS
jgi:hypothetical protein